MNKVLFFDFDGVIVDTFDLTYRLRAELEPELERETFRQYFRGNIYKVGVEITPTIEILKRQAIEYEQCLQKLDPKEGITELITELSSTYRRLAIISSSPTPVIRRYLISRNLERHFLYVMGGDVHYSKEVKMRKFFAGRTGLDARDAVMITDTLGDMIEAGLAGVQSIGVTWGFHPEDVLKQGKPRAIVSSVGELRQAIDQTLSHSDLSRSSS